MQEIARDTLLFSIAMGAIIGCASSKPRDASKQPAAPEQRQWQFTRPGPTTLSVEEHPLAIEVKPTLVKRGRTPLVYFVETGDPIVIVVSDLTSDTRLTSVPVGGRTIVRVESANGVFVGNQKVAPGPLPDAHEYGIYVQVDQRSMIRSESIRPSEGTKP